MNELLIKLLNEHNNTATEISELMNQAAERIRKLESEKQQLLSTINFSIAHIEEHGAPGIFPVLRELNEVRGKVK